MNVIIKNCTIEELENSDYIFTGTSTSKGKLMFITRTNEKKFHDTVMIHELEEVENE